MARIIHIGAGYDNEVTFFHLRAISMAEENRYSARFLEIKPTETEERKAELSYEIFVDALASWSDAVPTVKDKDGIESPKYPEVTVPAEAVQKYFETCTPETERIAPMIISRFRQLLSPEIVF